MKEERNQRKERSKGGRKKLWKNVGRKKGLLPILSYQRERISRKEVKKEEINK